MVTLNVTLVCASFKTVNPEILKVCLQIKWKPRFIHPVYLPSFLLNILTALCEG
jgi:hypothetical protein